MMGGVLNRSDSFGLNKLHIGSFPCYASESSFRQLDDVFLQTQTRIWLGEVVETRLDEETCTADLLADGLLLFKVSKVIWKMLLTKFMKLRSAKAYFSRSVSGKNSGRYMPYSNVDSFLKEKIERKEAKRDVEASQRRRRREMLLKSFAGGMSVLGMLILFFQLRKRSGAEEISETNLRQVQIKKRNKEEIFGKNREEGARQDGVYPAEKLRL